MAFADTMIDVLQKRAAESGLVLSKHQEPDEPFPRFEIALLGAAKDAPPLFSATSGGEALAWLDGMEKGRAASASVPAETAGEEISPEADKSIRELLVGLGKRIEAQETRIAEHERRIMEHEAAFAWLRQWLEGMSVICASPFAPYPYAGTIEDGEDEAA